MNPLLKTVFLLLCIISISIADDHLHIKDEHDIAICQDTIASNKADVTKTLEEAQRLEANGDKCTAAYRYEYVAIKYNETGNTTNATEMFNKAAMLFEQAGREQAPGNDCPIPWACKRSAYLYNETGNIAKVIEMCAISALLYEQQAIKHEINQEYISASVYYEEAADAYKQSGNMTKYTEMLMKIALVYEKYAMNLEVGKHYEIAVSYYMDASGIYKGLGDTTKTIEMQSKANSLRKEL